MARPKAALVVTKVDRRVAHRARTAPQLEAECLKFQDICQ